MCAPHARGLWCRSRWSLVTVAVKVPARRRDARTSSNVMNYHDAVLDNEVFKQLCSRLWLQKTIEIRSPDCLSETKVACVVQSHRARFPILNTLTMAPYWLARWRQRSFIRPASYGLRTYERESKKGPVKEKCDESYPKTRRKEKQDAYSEWYYISSFSSTCYIQLTQQHQQHQRDSNERIWYFDCERRLVVCNVHWCFSCATDE